MAASMHETIRLDTDLTGILPTNEYYALYGGVEYVRTPAAVIERSLTGRLLVHRIVDGTTPRVFDENKIKLVMTRAEKDLLVGDAGKILYFMPHYRDESDVTYRKVKFFERCTELQALDPMEDWWSGVIYLADASSLTVDS